MTLPHYGRNNQGTITVFVHPVCFKVVVAPLFIKWTNLTLGKIMTEKKKFAGFVAFATKGNAKKKQQKNRNWTSSQSKFLNAFKTNRLITVQLK